MTQFMSKIWSSPSARNVGKLLSANIVAQAIGILVYPVLTRIYSPDDFALLSLFTSIVGALTLLATAEYQYAIVLPKEENKARALVHLCLLITVVLVGVLCLSLPFSSMIANIFKAPELAHWWWAVPVSVASVSIWNILNYWYIRSGAFTRISGYQISQSLLSMGAKIGFGALKWMRGGLILATVLAPILSLAMSIGMAWKKYLRPLSLVRRKEVHEVAVEYANFPKFNLFRALVNSVGQSLPIWLLTPWFGLEDVGKLSLALMAAFVPLNIIARACYQVLFQRVSKLVQMRLPIMPSLMRFMGWIGACMVVVMPAVYIFVPQLVRVLFGAEWIDSATIIRLLFPYIMLTPICGSICFLSDIFAKQKIAMWMETGYVASVAVALFMGSQGGSFLTAITAYAWVGFGYLFIQLIWFISLVRQYQRTL